MSRRILCARLDSAGDMLLAGPAIRAVAAQSVVTVLAGPQGESAAGLLPGVSDVLVWRCPWIDPQPAPISPADIAALVATIAAERFDAALIFTSFHQSPLPTALVLRMAGLAWVGAISTDYPGSLLDLRHQVPEDLPEPERARSLTAAAGFAQPPGDDGRLRVRRPLPDVTNLFGSAFGDDRPYVVLHPGTSVPARAWPVEKFRQAARLLTTEGWPVVLTGSPDERALTRHVASESEGAPGQITDLGGRTDLAGLAAVLDRAAAVVVGNTGPAHLAAAVGTPVVSLFAPTVPACRWRPYGVEHVLLGDQHAPCRDTRVTQCPYAGHPCLNSVSPADVVDAVTLLAGSPQRRPVPRIAAEVRS